MTDTPDYSIGAVIQPDVVYGGDPRGANQIPWIDQESLKKIVRALKGATGTSARPIDRTKPAYRRAWKLISERPTQELHYYARCGLVIAPKGDQMLRAGATGAGGWLAAASSLCNFFAQTELRNRGTDPATLPRLRGGRY